ncbi:hypothetical protein quinque_005823 [Culex quinquefasciatus]
MANDREILREIWEGKIPVHFQLASDETDVEPEDFFLLIPRLSYFPLVTEKVRRHFLRVVSNELQDGEITCQTTSRQEVDFGPRSAGAAGRSGRDNKTTAAKKKRLTRRRRGGRYEAIRSNHGDSCVKLGGLLRLRTASNFKTFLEDTRRTTISTVFNPRLNL